MKYKANVIVFDFDGVIVDSGSDIANAVNYTLKLFEKPTLSKEEIIGYIGRGVENLISRSFKDSGRDTVKKAIPIYKEYYLDNCLVETKLYDNIKCILEYYKDRKMAVVTNKPEDLTKSILEGFGINGYFDMIIGPESVKKMKPNPEGLIKVIRAFGVSPQNVLMIGDSHTDVEAGKSAGTLTCGVTYGLGDTNALVKAAPDFLLDDIIGLKEYINQDCLPMEEL